MEIIIDGYNLLNSSPDYQVHGDNWEQSRCRLIKQLCEYQAYKRHKITVVFDGWKNGWPTEHREKRGNVYIVYSRKGEQADEVIKRMVLKGNGSPVVVTSDREIIAIVERAGARVLGAVEFGEKIKMAAYLASHDYPETYDESLDKPISTKKKGNPRRRSKKERQQRRGLKKL